MGASDPWGAWVDCDGPNLPDDLHGDGPSLLIIGNRFARAYKRAREAHSVIEPRSVIVSNAVPLELQFAATGPASGGAWEIGVEGDQWPTGLTLSAAGASFVFTSARR